MAGLAIGIVLLVGAGIWAYVNWKVRNPYSVPAIGLVAFTGIAVTITSII